MMFFQKWLEVTIWDGLHNITTLQNADYVTGANQLVILLHNGERYVNIA